jgi:CRISPR-associated protein Cmr4
MAHQDPFILGMLAEEFLHPGAGQSNGVIDLPVAREGHTGWPLAPDTGVKGALREHNREETWVDKVYGKPDGAGEAMIGGGRLLLLPVRHLEGTYAWTTCPGLLERFWRDWRRLFGVQPFELTAIEKLTPKNRNDGKAKTALSGLSHDSNVIRLDDLAFGVETFDPKDQDIKDALGHIEALMGGPPAASRLQGQVAVVTDAIFAEFAAYGLPVHAHNVLDENKQSLNLWYEESLPPDTLLYAPIASRNMKPCAPYTAFAKQFDKPCYRRLGGNETTGQGWVRVRAVRP